MRVVSSGSTGFAVLRREANEGDFSRPIVKEVVEKYLDCGNPRCGFARISCPDCAEERLVMFSCRTRGFCPSCHAKRIDDSRLAEIFAREVLAMLVRKELLSPEWAERILSWPHSGFNVHSLVRAKTKIEAERVGKYMLRPVLAFLTDFSVVDRIIGHLKLTFAAAKPPPSHAFEQVALPAAEESGEYFYHPNMLFGLDFRIFRCN